MKALRCFSCRQYGATAVCALLATCILVGCGSSSRSIRIRVVEVIEGTDPQVFHPVSVEIAVPDTCFLASKPNKDDFGFSVRYLWTDEDGYATLDSVATDRNIKFKVLGKSVNCHEEDVVIVKGSELTKGSDAYRIELERLPDILPDPNAGGGGFRRRPIVFDK